MSDDFINELANATRYDDGNPFTGGGGILILKDVKIFASTKEGGDPFTWVAEWVVKKSFDTGKGIPNKPGTSVSDVQKPTKSTFPKMAKSNMLKAHHAILGPGAELLSPADLAPILGKLLRPFPAGNPLQGRTNPAVPCPERGRQVAYETKEGTKKSVGRFFPAYSAIPQTDADLAENLKILAGLSEG